MNDELYCFPALTFSTCPLAKPAVVAPWLKHAIVLASQKFCDNFYRHDLLWANTIIKENAQAINA